MLFWKKWKPRPQAFVWSPAAALDDPGDPIFGSNTSETSLPL